MLKTIKKIVILFISSVATGYAMESIPELNQSTQEVLAANMVPAYYDNSDDDNSKGDGLDAKDLCRLFSTNKFLYTKNSTFFQIY